MDSRTSVRSIEFDSMLEFGWFERVLICGWGLERDFPHIYSICNQSYYPCEVKCDMAGASCFGQIAPDHNKPAARYANLAESCWPDSGAPCLQHGNCGCRVSLDARGLTGV